MPEGPTEQETITVTEVLNELHAVAGWIEGLRRVAAAVDPPHLKLAKIPAWEPGGINPPPRITRCSPPIPLWADEVMASDVVAVLAALRDWTRSIVVTLNGLPGDLTMPIPPADDTSP